MKLVGREFIEVIMGKWKIFLFAATVTIIVLVKSVEGHKDIYSKESDKNEINGNNSLPIKYLSKLYAHKILRTFSNHSVMKVKEFEKMLMNLESLNIKISKESPQPCIDGLKFWNVVENQFDDNQNISKPFGVDEEHLISFCPILLYHISNQTPFMDGIECTQSPVAQKEKESRASVWFYSTIALIGISLCGLMGVVVIPIVEKNYYFYVLQFFMALAVGTLAGDALLHLLPHAMRTTSDDMTSAEMVEMMMHRGLAALLGIISFCIIERLLKIITTRKNHESEKESSESGVETVKLQNKHGHSHGLADTKPKSLSSIVWMVILGDGLHNFTDGMAIGAAFSNSIAGGFSTTVAVFCHELPHEMGDFAVLLKAGMPARQAIYYNILSSILSFLGMCIGILIGEAPEATSWIFAIAAGLFIYIALVDMVNINEFCS